MSTNRISIPKTVATSILVKSRRRCCICYFVENITDAQRGQIAHLNHDPKENDYKNLVFLCLHHHDEYDSTTSQSKGLLESEVRHYRDKLYRTLKTTKFPDQIRAKTATMHKQQEKKTLDKPLYLKSINKPWRLAWLDDGIPELFAYKAINGVDGICRIERFKLNDDRVLFVCEEIDDNPGQNIPNSVESIAFQLCKRFDVKPEKLVLLEHFPTSRRHKELWHLVEFSQRDLRLGFKYPTWHAIEKKDWLRLGYKPIKKPARGMDRTSLLKPID